MLKLGAQLYTLREHTKTENDFAGTIKRVAEIGYKYVQVSGIGAGISAEFIKKVTEDNGVKVILTHTALDRIRNETEKVIEEHNIFDCPGIGLGGYYGDRTAGGFKKFAEDMKPVVAKIKAAGKFFLYHNHRFEFEHFAPGKTAIDIMLENSDTSAFKLTFDTYWAQAGGVDPAQFIKDYKDNIFVTHLKDMAVKEDKAVMTEIFTGNINFTRILKVSEKSGILWHFVEQDEVYMDAFESMKISYDNLMATGKFEK
jgi:sugar phosphate isomerase/epimerase